jgi:hypothetical protein
MLANLDGECLHPMYGPCVFEAKTASAYLLNDWENGIPDRRSGARFAGSRIMYSIARCFRVSGLLSR